MGCWNGTCILSGLAIRAGERAVAIPVIYEGMAAGTLFPIFGTYDDYGGLENVEETGPLKQLLALINKRGLAPKKDWSEINAQLRELEKETKICSETASKGSTNKEEADAIAKKARDLFQEYWKLEAQITEGQVRFTDLRGTGLKHATKGIPTLDDFVRVLERGGLGRHLEVEVKTFGEGVTWKNLSMVLIHRDVWDSVVKELTTSKCHTIYSSMLKHVSPELLVKYKIKSDSWTDVTARDHFDLKWDMIKETIDQLTFGDIILSDEVEITKENTAKVAALFNAEKRKYIKLEELDFLSEENKEKILKVRRRKAFGEENGFLFRQDEYIQYTSILTGDLIEMIGESIQSRDTSWKEAMFNLFLLKDIMHGLRKNFAMMSGAGSQADQHRVVHAMAQAALAVCETRSKEEDTDE